MAGTDISVVCESSACGIVNRNTRPVLEISNFLTFTSARKKTCELVSYRHVWGKIGERHPLAALPAAMPGRLRPVQVRRAMTSTAEDPVKMSSPRITRSMRRSNMVYPYGRGLCFGSAGGVLSGRAMVFLTAAGEVYGRGAVFPPPSRGGYSVGSVWFPAVQNSYCRMPGFAPQVNGFG